MTNPLPQRVDLERWPLSVTVLPVLGGAIARFRFGEIDILRPAPDKAIEEKLIRQMASYPLVPFSNRIINAQLKFEGRDYALKPNFPPEPHAIHGTGWQREWKVAKQSANELALTLQHDPDAQWPFHFAARQIFLLTADALTVSLELSNSGTRAMPAGLGFHPFFPRTEATNFETTWTGLWTMSDTKVPIEHHAIPPEADFSKSRALGAWRVDNCFTGWSRKALLGYATHRTEISATAGLNHCVTFIPVDGRPFIAVEPVSHIIDAFNLAAQGKKDTGMRVLKPGESWSESMTIRVMEGAA